jgi:ABC-type uncharacterized transport system ATPase subunit
LALSDRIVVIFDGKIMLIIDHDKATVERLGLLIEGIKA